MTEQSRTSSPFDFGKAMTDLDPNKMMDEFGKVFRRVSMPDVDVQAVLESQRKNMEALTSANKAALEGIRAVVTRQGEILQEAMEEVSDAVKGLAASGSPTEAAAKQGELLRQALDKALQHMRELAEMTAKTNTEAFDAIKNRLSESVDEIKELASGAKK